MGWPGWAKWHGIHVLKIVLMETIEMISMNLLGFVHANNNWILIQVTMNSLLWLHWAQSLHQELSEMTWFRSFINISSLYIWMSFAYAVIKFPSLPNCFKTRISGKINNNQSQIFSIEQHYCVIGDYEVGRTVFSSGQYISGLIHDGTRNHSIRYNFTNCTYEQLPSVYQPFSFVEEQVPGIQTIFDAFYAFQVHLWPCGELGLWYLTERIFWSLLFDFLCNLWFSQTLYKRDSHINSLFRRNLVLIIKILKS